VAQTSIRYRSALASREPAGIGRIAARLRHLDWILLGATLATATMGIIAVYAATKPKLLQAGIDPHYYLIRQAIYCLIGIVAMVVVNLFDYRKLEDFGIWLYGLLVVSLLAVMTPFGSRHLGSVRWFQLGPIQVQPSAFGAIILTVVFASYIVRHEEQISMRMLLALLGMGAIPLVLTVLQPDLGSAILMGVVLLAMLIGGGVRLSVIGLLLLGVVGVAAAAIHFHLLHHYQLERLLVFLHPNQSSSKYAYNLVESKAAIGSGGIFGTGLFKGLETNLAYVPAQHTDFIFTVIGEEMGFVGSAVLLALLGLIVWRLLRAAQLSRDAFGRLLCIGAVALLGFSVFENIGMTLGIMPIAGIPLPFVSYGGSALVSFFIAVGLALNVQMRRFR